MAGAISKYNTILKYNRKFIQPVSYFIKNGFHKYSTAETKNQYDIIIAGGGMVGTAFLLALGGPKYAKKELSNYSNRVSAINKGSSQLFKDINVWDKIRRKKAVNDMQVWDACSDASINFNDNMQNDIAFIIENDEILHALYSSFEETPKTNITILNKAKVKNLKLAKEILKMKLNWKLERNSLVIFW
ncbi:ubiquinone biosynthesis monooxygenase COQ6, mitochondrial-like [Ctenocephalides felis]|uniref:ubiquinone biosynthesis monooxygenase COQ6, mitochondrial-like n=1 Tax=Ctenocephalides felis TaxID=7515 RepID=UPI000E6E5629|nr:ubiquinone biosynthesis monooxygenase COQ6, mitochondrial-like [Ctenocephalides felis]